MANSLGSKRTLNENGNNKEEGKMNEPQNTMKILMSAVKEDQVVLSYCYYCSCPNGYSIDANGHNCIDINECVADNGNCSHDCTNTPGSYLCSCNNGYSIDTDGHNCS
uniref:EGF-like calcium-binding domain-containing protein n=1 Tax=Amphimedon queenslandica TaxID=400682 RepID=A0A1X7T1V8_AMPQE